MANKQKETIRPVMKRVVGIVSKNETMKTVNFVTNSDIAHDLEEYGTVIEDDVFQAQYLLFIDPRYDFEDVVKWIESYNE